MNLSAHLYKAGMICTGREDGKHQITISNTLPFYETLASTSTEEDAEYFISPFAISIRNTYDDKESLKKWASEIVEQQCAKLSHFQDVPERHIFLDNGDYPEVLPCLRRSIVFKTSLHKASPSPSLYYAVYMPVSESPISEAEYDIGFQGGFQTNPIRSRIPNIMQRCREQGMNTFHCDTGDFFRRTHKDEERERLTNSHQQLMHNSKFVLCPQGRGFNSIRFYETMSFGRIPVLLSDQSKLPLQHLIDYKKFIVVVPARDTEHTSEYIKQFLDSHDLEEASRLSLNTHRTMFCNTFKFLAYHFVKWFG